MTKERLEAILEELQEVESIEELAALQCFGQEYADAEFAAAFIAAVERLKATPPVREVVEEVVVPTQEIVVPAAKLLVNDCGGRQYRLLDTDVGWSTKPQVHAVMAILRAHAKPGDVLAEADIVAMMVKNEAVLQTRQGGKRIWDYYKGTHLEGLVAHGNVEKV